MTDTHEHRSIPGLLRDYKTTAIMAATGVSRQSVSQWRNGHALPDVGVLPNLAGFLRIPLAELTTIVAQARNDGGPRSVAV